MDSTNVSVSMTILNSRMDSSRNRYYIINTKGAMGGGVPQVTRSSSNLPTQPGYGAGIRSRFLSHKRRYIDGIAVGQKGKTALGGYANGGGGGGGGTFAWKKGTTTPLIIAGGGGQSITNLYNEMYIENASLTENGNMF